MNLPLYKSTQIEPPTLCAKSHHGLWFERFFNQYDSAWKVVDQGKSAWIKQVAGPCGDAKELQRHAVGLVERLAFLGGDYRGFETDWHFATGLGNQHPVENGFLWHPTLGVPYLPGAAVKGLVRAWVEQWDDTERDRRVREWFGVDPDMAKKNGIPEQAGGLIFFDALPVGPVLLTQDVMTPHYGKWYEEGGKIEAKSERDLYSEENAKRIPADWHDPVPVPFMVVKKASFLFAIAPRRPAFQDQVEPALQALQNALDWLGAGAKTAVGYGRMKSAPDVVAMLKGWLADHEREARRIREDHALNAALLSPCAKELERAIRDKNLASDKNAFNQNVDAWLSRLETDPRPDAIERLATLTRQHYKGLLENPDKTEGKKQKPAFSDWQRKLARRLNALAADNAP